MIARDSARTESPREPLMPKPSSRREFLEQTVATASLAALASAVLAGQDPPGASGLPTRVLGRTGQRVSIVCLGGWHIGAIKDDAESVRLMHARPGRRHHLLRQRLGLPRRRRRRADGQGPGHGRPPRQGLPHDQELRARLRGLDAEPGRQPAPPAHRPHRPLAVPRDRLRQRPGLGLREGRHQSRAEARKAGKVRFIGFTGHKDPRIHLGCSTSPTTGTPARCPST